MAKNIPYQYQRIFDDLCASIQKGEIQPGEKLPTEGELAERYRVSRITSKKALSMLADRGLVSRRPGSGTFLNRINTENLRPHAVARDSAQAPRLLGLVADSLLQSFGLNLYYELDRAALEAGFHLYLRMSDCDQKREAEEIDYLRRMGAEGIFVIPTRARYYNRAILRLMLDHYPVHILDSALSGIQVPFVSSSNRMGGSLLTQHLIDLGHRHIALVTVDRKTAVSLEDRHCGYVKTLEQNSLPYRKEYVLDKLVSGLTGFDQKRGAEADLKLLSEFFAAYPEVSGVVVLQYALASLVRRAAEMAGRRVPDTLSIAVFDEIYDASGYYEYTHIKQDEAGIAREAVRRMVDCLEGKAIEQESYIPPKMLPGATTAPPGIH